MALALLPSHLVERGARAAIAGRVVAIGALTALLLVTVAAAGAGSGPPPPDGGARAAPPPPPYDAARCNQCHAKLTQKKEVHRIFLGGTCADCHLPSDKPGKCKAPVGKGWKLAAPDPKLCLDCHDGLIPEQQRDKLHPVINVLGCTACHDPHSSDLPKHLKDWPAMQLCYGCHDRKDDKKDVHGALKQGLCLGCHDPHAGAEKPLLRKPRGEVCFGCHKPEALITNHVRHPPVLEGRCLDCHSPHSTDLPKHTLREGKDLCLKCHDIKAPGGLKNPRSPQKRIDLDAKVVHPPVQLLNCQECHEQTHAASNLKLLKKRPPELCYDCHDRKDEQPYTHSAVRVGDCPVCHNPHQSTQNRLLRAGDLKTGVMKDLCFRCHQDDVTGRNFVHRPVRDGKCMTCHDPHGAKNPFNLVRGRGKEVCYTCHKEKDNVKTKHKALERYGCTACHDPHGSGNKFQLAKPVNELCQSCHTDKKDGYHVTNFVAGGHKITGGLDPRCREREFNCASCHNPHGSDNPRMFHFGSTMAEVCDGCHGDRTGAHPELKAIIKLTKPDSPDGGPPQETPPLQRRCKTGLGVSIKPGAYPVEPVLPPAIPNAAELQKGFKP